MRAGGGNEGRERAGATVNEQLGNYQLTMAAGRERDGIDSVPWANLSTIRTYTWLNFSLSFMSEAYMLS